MDDTFLIHQVEKFRFLYDKKNQDFKNKIKRENAWTTIGVILDQSPKSCEQRWKVLRTKYNNIKREYKLAPSGCGGEATKITWPHFKMMSFLEPFIVPRQTRTSYKSCSASMVTASGEQSRLSQVWSRIENFMEMDSQSCDDINQLSECETIEASEVEDNTNQDSNFLVLPPVTPPTPVVTPSPAASPTFGEIPIAAKTATFNKTPNNNTRGKNTKKRKVEEHEDETGAKIAKAFDNFSLYLTQMRNSQEVGNDERMFGQQVAQDLSKIPNVEDRMKIKMEIYHIFYEYFKNQNR